MHERLELRRVGDDRVYTFRRAVRDDGSVGYERDDLPLWIVFRSTLGWVVIDDRSREITGMPWAVPLGDQQPTHPPAGEWVSNKAGKSYVYRLRYLEAASDNKS